MDLTLVTPAPDSAFDPWFAAAKAYLRRDEADDDVVIRDLLRAAIGFFDGPRGRLARALVTQRWRLTLDGIDEAEIALPLPPLKSVDAITYIDTGGTERTLQPSDYVVRGSDPGVLCPADWWPRARRGDAALTIIFTAGYGGITDVPAPLKAAVFEYLTALYDSRGTFQTVPPSIVEIADAYRARAFG